MNKKRIGMQKVFIRISVAIFLGLLFFARPSNLVAEPFKPPVSVSFSIGYFQPREDAFKDLYGNNKFRLSFSMRYELKKNLSLYSGFRYLSCNGETEITGPLFQDVNYSLKLKVYSIPVGLVYSHPFKNIHPFFGGGISYNIYQENWDQIDISFEGNSIGFFIIGGIEYFVSKKFSLLGRTQYSSIPTDKGSVLDDNVNLGGTEFSVGFSFYF